MVQVLRSHRGGILSLKRLINEHGEAIEADLIDRGLRLRWVGTPRLTWRDLHVIVKHLLPDSALVRSMNPDWHWDLTNQLLAEAVDTLHWLKWSKTKGAHSKPPHGMPDRIPRPGVESNADVIKFDVMSFDEAMDWLGWEREMEVN